MDFIVFYTLYVAMLLVRLCLQHIRYRMQTTR